MHLDRFTLRALFLVVPLAVGCGGDDDASDLGGGWTAIDGPGGLSSLTDVWVFSPTDVLVAGSPTQEAAAEGAPAALMRFDGKSWSAVDVGGAVRLVSLWAEDPDAIWAVGGDTVAYYDGAQWTTTSLADQGAQDLQAVWAASPNDVWVSGEVIVHYDGASWTQVIPRPPAMSSIWGASSSAIWGMGRFDFTHFDGQAWSTLESGAFGGGGGGGGGDGDIWGFGADDVWIATGDEGAAHYDGQSWSLKESDELTGDLNALWGTQSSDLWAAGSAGQIARYDGASWSSVSHQESGAPYLIQLSAIHGSSADNVWAVGAKLGQAGVEGIVYRR